MASSLFLEPLKGSKVLLHRAGQYFESLAYACTDTGAIFARRGAAYLRLRPSKVAQSGAMASGEGHTVEVCVLPDGVSL